MEDCLVKFANANFPASRSPVTCALPHRNPLQAAPLPHSLYLWLQGRSAAVHGGGAGGLFWLPREESLLLFPRDILRMAHELPPAKKPAKEGIAPPEPFPQIFFRKSWARPQILERRFFSTLYRGAEGPYMPRSYLDGHPCCAETCPAQWHGFCWWGSYEMERFASAYELIAVTRPERPVLGLRPHAAGRAARWFLGNFPGDVAYAYKANSSVFLLGALYGAGIRHFDVASLPELEDAATIPGAKLHYMHPVKSREAIRRAYALGVRCFALDGEDELAKIVAETGGARDLELYVRLAVPAKNSRIPLERKFGIAGDAARRLLRHTRKIAARLGITFHVGSQTTAPEAFATALAEARGLILKAGVPVDALDVGGGFPSRYADSDPAPLSAFMETILDGVADLPFAGDIHLVCEPGRALVAEAESLIVRIDARRGNSLYINDGAYGTLFDAAHLGFVFPARLVSREPEPEEAVQPFELWGPTCDSIDQMRGPFLLPATVQEGDYIELGNIGAYGRALAGHFNGYGRYDEAILMDEPMFSMYPPGTEAPPLRRPQREQSRTLLAATP